MSILLPGPNEHDGSARNMRHGQGGTDLIAHGIEFGEHDAIDLPPVSTASERTIEHGQLIHPIVPHEGLADEEHQIRRIIHHELGQRLHERHVVLHASRRVDEDDIVIMLRGVPYGGGCDRGWILGVSHLMEGYAERFGVDVQLFYGTGTEGIACRQEGGMIVRFEVVGYFGEGRGFAHPVDSHHDDHVRFFVVGVTILIIIIG
mmetsp:Transcript_9143/g.12979  ORF Transcript_9143/g.12979 Transcript_9143/m.12979 type:complete len:204 (-) Transcript_9143:675-1286(-)